MGSRAEGASLEAQHRLPYQSAAQTPLRLTGGTWETKLGVGRQSERMRESPPGWNGDWAWRRGRGKHRGRQGGKVVGLCPRWVHLPGVGVHLPARRRAVAVSVSAASSIQTAFLPPRPFSPHPFSGGAAAWSHPEPQRGQQRAGGAAGRGRLPAHRHTRAHECARRWNSIF